MLSPLRPIPFRVMAKQLEHFGVIDTGEMPDPTGVTCHIFRWFRMGLGTGKYYSFPYDGENAIVVEPELEGILAYFDIDHDEFMDDCPSHEHNN